MTRSFLNVLPALCGLSLISTSLAIKPGFPYGSQKVRGVNLGGWLVLEPWITPSLFDKTGNDKIIDEYTFAQLQDHDTALAALRTHWDTWITEKDFSDIAAAGLNHVRLPIGYWAFETAPGEPYIGGQLPYFEKAIGWAEKHKLKLIIDLHGAPGSQNGFDNSGQLTDNPVWHSTPSYQERTRAVIKRITDMVKNKPNVVPVVQALNEPAGFREGVINAAKQYFLDSYDIIRGASGAKDTVLMIQDAFEDVTQEHTAWDGFMTSPEFEGVLMDAHIYEMFIPERIARGMDEHIIAACARGSGLKAFHIPTVVGEWTPASNDCARYLNGRGSTTRWQGQKDNVPHLGDCKGYTGSGDSFSEQYKDFLRKHWEAQTMSYEKGAGWLQWTWKAEEADEWSYQAGLKYGWIPRNPTDYKYPGICNIQCNTGRQHVRFGPLPITNSLSTNVSGST